MHGTTAITAITVQNTVAVSAVQTVAPEIISAQIRAVAEDLGVDAVKIGMLGDVATIEAVAAALDALPGDPPVVHDPVMVAESGARLLPDDAVDGPRAAHPPAGDGRHAEPPGGARARRPAPRSSTERSSPAPSTRSARAPSSSPAGIATQATDLLFDGQTLTELPGERHPDGAAHGSGCTHSSTLAARLALGDPLPEAARRARAAAAAAVRDGLRDLGAGAGPVDVFGLAERRAR